MDEDKRFKELEAVAIALISDYKDGIFHISDVKLLRGVVEEMLGLKPKCVIRMKDKAISLARFVDAVRKEEIVLDSLINEAERLRKEMKNNKFSEEKAARLYYLLGEIRNRSPSAFKTNPSLIEALKELKARGGANP